MKNIVMLVGWQRPEFMELCLKHVQEAELSENFTYLFCLDYGYDIKYEELISNFPYEKFVIRRPNNGYKIGKQSFNVIAGLLACAKATKDIVYYIEEDIFIGKDFFKYHNSVLKQSPDVMCSIASKCNDTPHKTIDDKGAYYIGSDSDYQCWGTAWKKEKLLQVLERHHNQGYYSNPLGYILKEFPDNFLKERFCEQDGLTRREMMKQGLRCAFPHVPRAYHAGFYGYNRVQPRPTTHLERVKKLQEVCYSKELMDKHSLYKDSQPYDLNINENSFYYAEQ
jgi:hypothetical protein